MLPSTLRRYGAVVVATLESWFEVRGRAFVWRLDSRSVAERLSRGDRLADPYVVLVSEVMLQQTQTSRVAATLPEFLERFATVGALAAASRGEVLRAWHGLGYNNRAVRLHEAACAIVTDHQGEFPREIEDLRRLPGIGSYTASAIACFAFGAHVPVVDVNVQRVLSRIFFKCHTVDARMPIDAVSRVDAALIPKFGAYWWHQALMDLGATICTARRPSCDRCALVAHCLSGHPRTITLHSATSSVEPMIASAPRRIWRGRIVAMLRAEHGGLAVGELIGRLPDADSFTSTSRDQLFGVVETLLVEEMLVVDSAVVKEGGKLEEATVVRLPW